MPSFMQHCDEFASRRREHPLAMPDDRDCPPHLPAAQSNDAEEAGPQLGGHRELAAAGHAIAARHRQLHGLPIRQFEVVTRSDTNVCPGRLDAAWVAEPTEGEIPVAASASRRDIQRPASFGEPTIHADRLGLSRGVNLRSILHKAMKPADDAALPQGGPAKGDLDADTVVDT